MSLTRLSMLLATAIRRAATLASVGMIILYPRILLATDGSKDSAEAKIDTSKAYVIADSLFVLVKDHGKAEIRLRHIVRVKSIEGAGFATMGIVENAFSKLAAVEAKQFDLAGKTLDSLHRKQDLEKNCGFGPGGALYSDACQYFKEFKKARPPYTVDWSYTVTLGSIGLFFGWVPDSRIFMQSGYCELKTDPNVRFDIQEAGAVPPRELDSTGDPSVRRWIATNVPAVVEEDSEPWPQSRATRLYLMPAAFRFAETVFDGNSWNSLSRSVAAMIAKSFKSSPSQDQFLREIETQYRDSVLLAIHRALSNRLRYVAIALGWGGWIPHPTSETFDHGYGDCKDLASLYANLFAGIGVRSGVALTATRHNEEITPEIRTIGRFNHVIMFYQLGPDTVWVDPTCFDCALGDLPYSDEGVNVLIVDPRNGELVRTPISKCDENQLVRKFMINLSEDFGALFALKALLRGNPAHGTKDFVKGGGATETIRALANELGIGDFRTVNSRGLSIGRQDFSQLDLGLDWTVPRFAKNAGASYIVDLVNIQILSDTELLDLSTRKHALEIGYPRTIVDTIRVSAPAGFAWKTLPDSVDYNSDFGDLHVSSAVAADTAIIIRSLSRKHNIIEPEQFVAYQQFRKDIATRGRAIATLVKK